MSDRAVIDPTARVHWEARLEPLGETDAISIGAHSQIRGQLLTAAHGGRISIGGWCYIGEGSRLWAASEIVIGDRVLIAHGCDLHDWDSHPADPALRHEQFRHLVQHGHAAHGYGTVARPIRIEDDAWIGFGATILKGVTVGRGAIVAARSLVVEDVPAGALVGGFPARSIRARGW